MKIERNLNLAVQIDREDGSSVWVHSKPLSREAFNDSWRMLTGAYSEITRGQITPDAAMRVACRLVRDAAKQTGRDGDDVVAYTAFINEIRRTSQIIVRSERGWESQPFANAVSRGTITEDDADEVENILCFFILTCAMAQANRRAALTRWIPYFVSAQLTSSDSTAFAASLPTSTETESSGATQIPGG